MKIFPKENAKDSEVRVPEGPCAGMTENTENGKQALCLDEPS